MPKNFARRIISCLDCVQEVKQEVLFRSSFWELFLGDRSRVLEVALSRRSSYLKMFSLDALTRCFFWNFCKRSSNLILAQALHLTGCACRSLLDYFGGCAIRERTYCYAVNIHSITMSIIECDTQRCTNFYVIAPFLTRGSSVIKPCNCSRLQYYWISKVYWVN